MNISYEKLEPWPNKDNKLTFLTGAKKLEPVKYHIVSTKVRYWLFFTKSEYYIDSDFGRFENYNSVEECIEMLTKMRVPIRDIVIDV